MILSPAERSYLYDSLAKDELIRPDARADYQFRPIEVKTSFLPSSNGSARVRLTDGSEIITSIKSKVVLAAEEKSLIECDIDIPGFRDDSNFVANLKYNMTSLLNKSFPFESLKLTSKYAFKLFIDCVVISYSSFPLTFISIACYLALKSTKLPKLISDVNDEETAEQPLFSDDWENAQYLGDLNNSKSFNPPLIIVIGVVGKNLLFDPSAEEEQVLENGIIISWYNNDISTPIHNLNFSVHSNMPNYKGLSQQMIMKSILMARKHCANIVNALDQAIGEQSDDGVIF